MIRWSLLGRILRHPLPRVTAALGWTVLVCLLMLLPGKDSIAEDTSGFFGGTDITDAFGHVLLFAMLTVLWYAALTCWLAPAPALKAVLAIGTVFGLLLELGQGVVPERGISLLDFAANALGVLAATVLLTAQSGLRREQPR